MKLYGIRFAKGFQYGTMETVFCTQKGNRERIPDFSFFYYMVEDEGKHFLINARLIMSKLTYEQAVSEGTAAVRDRLQKTEGQISLVEERECFYNRFLFEIIGGHTPDSSVLHFQMGNDTYCITGDECYLCKNMEQNIPIGISVCREKNERFIQKAYDKGWIPLPFHDAGVLKKYERLTENIVRIF